MSPRASDQQHSGTSRLKGSDLTCHQESYLYGSLFTEALTDTDALLTAAESSALGWGPSTCAGSPLTAAKHGCRWCWCLQLGAPCCMCPERHSGAVIQTCSCCPRGFCQQHAMQAAMTTPSSNSMSYIVCVFCQHNPKRVEASHKHSLLLSNFYCQTLYTPCAKCVSMCLPGKGPAVSTEEFSVDCFKHDLERFEQQVGLECASLLYKAELELK